MKRSVATAILGALAVLACGTSRSTAADNEFIKVGPGSKGLAISSKATGVQAELFVTAAKGESKMALPAGKIKLSPKCAFIEVAPAGGALELCVKSRFAIVPGFHHDDALFDPTVCKFKKIYVPSENWLLVIPDGGKTAFVLAWPIGAIASPQIPILTVEGEGNDARFATARVNFAGKSVFVGVLDNVAYVDDLSTRGLAFTSPVNDGGRGRGYSYAEVKTDAKVPWGTQFWTSLARPVGPPNPKQPAWMRSSETAVSGVPVWTWMVGEAGSQWDDILDWYERPSLSIDSQWVLHLDKRWAPYYAAVVYPRAHGQKKNTVTLGDILQGALGKQAFMEAIDAAGINANGVRIPKGQPAVPATCAGYGYAPSALTAKDRDRYRNATLALYNFCFYNKQRTEQLLDAAAMVSEICRTKAKNPKLKTLLERIAPFTEEPGKFFADDNAKYCTEVRGYVKNYPELMSGVDLTKVGLNGEWFGHIRDYYFKVYDDWAVKDNAKAQKMLLRDHWTSPGGTLDGMCYAERRNIQRLCQEITLAGVENPESRELATELRKMLQQALRAGHYKEAWMSSAQAIEGSGK